MTRIVLFHSVLGVRQGVLAAAEHFREAGHDVRVVDQYAGRVFDDYPEASEYAESIGYPALMEGALAAVSDEPLPIVVAGFSNGAGLAEYVAASRNGSGGGVVGTLQFAGAIPLNMAGLNNWPANTPVQLHYAMEDPFRDNTWIEEFVGQVRTSGSAIQTFLDYPIAGHLFTDESMPNEYDAAATALAFERALAFLDQIRAGSV